MDEAALWILPMANVDAASTSGTSGRRRSDACRRAFSSSSIAPPRITSAVPTTGTAFEHIKLRHRALVDVVRPQVATTLFGKPASLPMAIAPTGAAGLCWHEGELELAKAAAKAKIPLTLSTASMTPMEKIAAVGGRLWFQLYVWKQRELSHQLIQRAKPQRFRSADRHGRFSRLAQPRIQHA